MNINYNEFISLLNNIGYWLVENKKMFKKRNIYEIGNRKADLKMVEKVLLERKKVYSEDELTAEYSICAICDNTNLDFLPNYVTRKRNGEKIMKNVYVDMTKRLQTFRNENKKNPTIIYLQRGSGCVIPYTQSPLLLKQGIEELGQVTGYSCGPHCLKQGFYNLTGVKVPEKTIMGWAGTTTAGTSHAGLETAVAQFNKQYNQKISIKWQNLSQFGGTTAEQFRNIGKLKCEQKFIFFHLLYRGKWGHYETYKTLYGDYFDIANSLGTKQSSGYIGYIERRSYDEQKKYINGISQPSVAIMTK